jgi:hypothetical protein
MIGPRELANMIGLLLVGLVVGLYLWVRWVQWGAAREGRRLERAMNARNQARWTAEQSWVDANRWPLTHYDVYATAWEFTEDVARLKSMGFSVEEQEHAEDGIRVTYSLTRAYERRAQPEDWEAPAVPQVPYRPWPQDHHEAAKRTVRHWWGTRG